jgi:hypothetical protein
MLGSVKRDEFGRAAPAYLQDLEWLDLARPTLLPGIDLVATFPRTEERRLALQGALLFDTVVLTAADKSMTWGLVSRVSADLNTIGVRLSGISPAYLAGEAVQWALAADEALQRVHARRRQCADSGAFVSRSDEDDDLISLMFAETYTSMTLLKRLSVALQLAEEADRLTFTAVRSRFDGAAGPLLRAVRNRLEHPDRVRDKAFEEKYGTSVWPLAWDNDGRGQFGGFDDGAAADILPAVIDDLRQIRRNRPDIVRP